MKKTRKHWLPFFNKVLSLVLVFLGFNACSDDSNDEDGGGMLLMYGMPPTEYSVKAKVVNEQNVPIEGIQVEMKIQQDGHILKNGLTNSKGEYQANIYYDRINVVFTDIDGDKNGAFEKDSVQRNLDGLESDEFTIKLKAKK